MKERLGQQAGYGQSSAAVCFWSMSRVASTASHNRQIGLCLPSATTDPSQIHRYQKMPSILQEIATFLAALGIRMRRYEIEKKKKLSQIVL